MNGTKNLKAALLKVRAEIGTIKKEDENPFFHSKYAGLPSILDAVDPILAKHGLLLLQPPGIESGLPYVSTEITHVESGESIEARYPLPGPEEPQKLAAALTYARRCAIVSLLSLNVDEDDDGNAAAVAPSRPQAAPAARSAPASGGGSGKKEFGTCPDCGASAIIKGKAEFGGGYLCWKKEGGCGAKFQTDPAAG